MRSTPARVLHNGQLIVDRYSLSKIAVEPFRLPYNTVSVDLTNQLTGEQVDAQPEMGRARSNRRTV
jgi:hypothetical protein